MRCCWLEVLSPKALRSLGVGWLLDETMMGVRRGLPPLRPVVAERLLSWTAGSAPACSPYGALGFG
jgi:hypothetical protein